MKCIYALGIALTVLSTTVFAVSFNVIENGVEISGSVDIWDIEGNYFDGNSYDHTHPFSANDSIDLSAGNENDPVWSAGGRAHSSGGISISNSTLSVFTMAETDADANPVETPLAYHEATASADAYSWITFDFTGANQFVELYGEATILMDTMMMPSDIKLYDLTSSERIYFETVPREDPQEDPPMPDELFRGIATLDTSHTYRFEISSDAGATGSPTGSLHMMMMNGNDAMITIIPEPTTISLLSLSILFLTTKRKTTSPT